MTRLMGRREKLQGDRDRMQKRLEGTDGDAVPEHIRLAEKEQVWK